MLLIILFGALMSVAGLVLIASPGTVFGILRKHADSPPVYWSAVGVRLVIGALLITQAAEFRWPVVATFLGWVFVVSGGGLALIGQERFQRLLTWVLARFSSVGQAAGVVALALGVILVFGFL